MGMGPYGALRAKILTLVFLKEPTMRSVPLYFVLMALLLMGACSKAPHFDILVKNGRILDGSGDASYIGDIGINADTIAALGNLESATADELVDASNMAVAPGFINMLSWATVSLIEDGRSMGDIKQGVTLEVFGEGTSMGPWSPGMKREEKQDQGAITYDIDWTTLNQYLESLTRRGISPNVASFVGATTLRVHTVGYEDRAPTPQELDSMKLLVKQAMEQGALGVGSSLIYAPAFYSSTEELIEISKVAAAYDGMYISHMRSEGSKLLESLDELLQIADKAGIRAEIYHLKQSGRDHWNKFDAVVAKVDSARAAGLEITADMYTYVAGATGLDASMPPWVQEGGYKAWAERLQDPEIRARVKKEMMAPALEWESLMQAAGDPGRMLLVGFRNDSLKYLTGKS